MIGKNRKYQSPSLQYILHAIFWPMIDLRLNDFVANGFGVFFFHGSHGALSTARIADTAKGTKTRPHVKDESSQDLLEEATQFFDVI